jgi:hypothetical protein
MPLLFSSMKGTFLTREDYLKTAASRRGVFGSLDQRLELFERACRGEWSFDPLVESFRSDDDPAALGTKNIRP